MISIYNPWGSGITYGIDNLIGTIEAYKEQVVCVYELELEQGKGSATSHSFAVVFREKGAIGQFTVLLNHLGTNTGRGCGGTGSIGYCELMSCIENNNIEVKKIYQDDTPKDWLEVLEDGSNEEIVRETWLKIIHAHIHDLFPCVANYPISDEWKERRSTWR